jgi:hypothetical protein
MLYIICNFVTHTQGLSDSRPSRMHPADEILLKSQWIAFYSSIQMYTMLVQDADICVRSQAAFFDMSVIRLSYAHG